MGIEIKFDLEVPAEDAGAFRRHGSGRSDDCDLNHCPGVPESWQWQWN